MLLIGNPPLVTLASGAESVAPVQARGPWPGDDGDGDEESDLERRTSPPARQWLPVQWSRSRTRLISRCVLPRLSSALV